ncbi:tetratricopeptide repeat protein [Pseudoalteromonas rubra]|uniref:histidine kinase n=1 Tax=Pseudoalteromonas rubra TaxID=43658 RepID=A0A0U3ID09_9GAMM|nr:tetratricopeptide repeat protein [Pseudoalteromonas rubra]ALU45680.1 hypothetical protein AT705_22335 [Pseudoalteromonas rubra]
MKKILLQSAFALLSIVSVNAQATSSTITLPEIKKLELSGNYEQALSSLTPFYNHSDHLQQLNARFVEAKIYRKQGKHQQAIDALGRLSEKFQLDIDNQFQLYKELGINYRRMGKLDEAETNYKQALNTAKAMNNSDLIGQSYSNLGTLYDYKNELAKAMQFQLKARDALKGSQLHGVVANNFYNLGDMAIRFNDLEQAEFFFTKALIADKKAGELSHIAGTALRLAQVTAKRKNYLQAVEKATEAIELLEQIPANVSLARAHQLISGAYLKLEKGEKAEEHAKLSMHYASQSDDQIQNFHAHVTMARAYLYLQKSKLARPHYEWLTRFMDEEEENSYTSQLYYNLKAKFDFQQGRHQEAYEALSQANTFFAQTIEKANSEQALTHKRTIDTVMQQQRLDDSEHHRKLTESLLRNAQLMQRMWLFVALTCLLLGILISYILYSKNKTARLKANLYQQNLKQKDQMLADISHELRTPLSVLKLHIEALEYNLLDDDTLAYSKINEKISQLNHLISDVYQLSQADNQAMVVNNQPYCTRTLADSYCYDIKRLVKSNGLHFSADISIPTDASVLIDKPKLDRVIDNLAKNACLYTDKPGQVRVKIRQNCEGLIIQLEDSSPGVSDNEKPRLFERLYRVESSRSRATGGSGLGLSLCKSLVESMSGEIELRDSRLGGLSIRVTLRQVTSELPAKKHSNSQVNV